jgi:hypothetical protein
MNDNDDSYVVNQINVVGRIDTNPSSSGFTFWKLCDCMFYPEYINLTIQRSGVMLGYVDTRKDLW